MRRLTPATIDTDLLAKLQAHAPLKQRAMWERGGRGRPKRFKEEITSQLLPTQNARCAYCGLKMRGEHPHRDHIAPKESHPEYTFQPENLVLTCYPCNSEFKGKTDTISLKKGTYIECLFNSYTAFSTRSRRQLAANRL